MQTIELRNILASLESKDQGAGILRSLRHDELIWSNLIESSEDHNAEITKLLSDQKLNPGTLGLLTLNPELVYQGYPESRLHAAFLEDCMGEFESFLQQHNSPMTLSQAAKLAVVLVEKRKISPSWSTILLEVITRMRISGAQAFENSWKTPLAIAINLINNREELLADLFKLQTIDQGIVTFNQIVLCLPISSDEIPQLIAKIASDLPSEYQEKIVKHLVSISEKELARETAQLFLGKYLGVEVGKEDIREYWNAPEAALQNALVFQQTAGIAQIAGNADFALNLINKSSEILDAVSQGVHIQRISLSSQTGTHSGLEDLFENMNPGNIKNPAVMEELALAGYLPDEPIDQESASQPVVQLLRAKLIHQAGNSELAKTECENALICNNEKTVKSLVQYQPRFNPGWDPTEPVLSLLDMGAIKEAAKLAKVLLAKNPSSCVINHLAARALLKSNNHQDALPVLELLSMSGDRSIEINRSLAECYQVVGDHESSYQYRKQIIADEGSDQEDLLKYAESAVRNNLPQEAFNAIADILEKDPNNASALTINGNAFYQIGDLDNAISSLSNAIEVGSGDPKPWVTLSEVYVKQMDDQKAIDTLRKGIISLPSSAELKEMLAQRLMKNGSVAEALPLLNELAEESDDLELNLLQSKAMKTLGLVDYSDRIASLFSKYPENTDIAFDYAEELIRNGKRAEAKSVLADQMSRTKLKDDKVLTYVDAVVGFDFQFSGSQKHLSHYEEKIVKEFIEDRFTADPDNLKANVLNAELLTQKGYHQQAFDLYSKLIERQRITDKSFVERIQGGFALTSAYLGKFELALAAIKEAVDTKPEWVGLQKTLAEIYALAGQISDALEQAGRVLAIAPTLADNLFWFVEFLTKLGKTEEADAALKNGLVDQPGNILMKAKLAGLKLNSGNIDEAKELADSIKQDLTFELNEDELIALAKLFDQFGDSETSLECLKTRISNDSSIPMKIDLAGYYYQIAQFEKALETLQQIESEDDPSRITKCFTADTLTKTGSIQAAYDLVHSDSSISNDHEIDLNLRFIPDCWKKLVNSKYPALELEAECAFQLGKPELSLKSAKLLLAQEPDNADARIIALESALALGEYSDLAYFVDIPFTLEKNNSSDHLAALKIEMLLNKDQISEAQRLFFDFAESKNLCVRATRVRLKALTGELLEAETDLEAILSEKNEGGATSDHFEIGAFRNLIEAAVVLQRWNEALDTSRETARKYSWCEESVMQYLITLVKSIEFDTASKNLALEKHTASSILQSLNILDELAWIEKSLTNYRNKEVERWLLRGRMANAPGPENIRAFAMITPYPDDAAALMAALYSNGQASIAVQVSKKYASNPSVLFELAIIHLDSNVNEAVKTLDQLLAIEPIHPIAFALKSKAFEKINKLDLSISDLDQAICFWPNEINWQATAADLWQKSGNDANAIIHLEAAHELNPGDLKITLLLGKAHLLNGNSTKCVDTLETLSLNTPNNYELWEVLADAYSQRGDLNSALRAIAKASELNPFSSKPNLMSGKINLSSGNLDKALEQAKLALARNEKDAESMVFLAKVLFLKGEKQAALAALEKASQCENATVQTMIDHVTLVKEINGISNAKELIAKLSAKYPENVELLKMLAKAQEENGDTSNAEQTAKRALQVNPEEPELHLLLGKINAKDGHLDQAIHHLSQGIAQKVDQLDGYLMLSKVYEQQREFTKAMDTLKQAMEINPGDTRSYLAAANLYRNSKNYSAAERVLQKAVEVDPKDLAIRRQLGALLALNLVHQSQEVSSQS
ncbi:MAG: hypothetical protein C0401_00650 [Anaerolinea sp.]|nr:hypothetical protein [Anaerolinea sp.]